MPLGKCLACQWINQKGSNDHPCIGCRLCPSLPLRYQCENCLTEACKFCLEESGVYMNPPEKIETYREQTLELRLLALENKYDQLLEKYTLLEILVNTLTKEDGD